MPDKTTELYIGLMSGTSMDGIDAALVDFSTEQPKLIASYNQAWPEAIRKTLIEARDIPDDALDTLAELDLQTAEVFAQACTKLLDKTQYTAEDIIAIGNHGQTIRHRPDITEPFSLQIGNADLLAKLTNIDVVYDFRTADIKAGGQGAPLAPAFHQAVFSHQTKNRVIVNIGGISNITVLEKSEEITINGFDCGPGNTLMDAWITQQQNKPYDKDGSWAKNGTTNARLLANMLMDDFFQRAPPKSTGFEYFNLSWLKQKIEKTGINKIKAADIQSTLCDLTATSIIQAINQYAKDTDEIFICGGGAHNSNLIQRLQKLTQCTVQSTEALGIHPDWVEAMAFSWLAYRYCHKKTGNLPSVTGARESVILGERVRLGALG